MWVSINKKWNVKSSPLERFFVEKFIQRCDHREVLGNQHRTINGFSQLHELIKLSSLTKVRGRTVRSLTRLISESKDKLVKQNIINDTIIKKYFSDLHDYIRRFNTDSLTKGDKVNLTTLNNFHNRLEVFRYQLSKHYFNCLLRDILSIPVGQAMPFQRNAESLTELIDLLIPFYTFHGYSLTFLSQTIIDWLVKGSHVTIQKVLDQFQIKSTAYTLYFTLGHPRYLGFYKSVAPFLMNENRAETSFAVKNSNMVQASSLHRRVRSKLGLQKKPDSYLVVLEVEGIDPQACIRQIYSWALKEFVAHEDRKELTYFLKFFDNACWSDSTKELRKVRLDEDPIHVSKRKSTLTRTFDLLKQFDPDFKKWCEDKSRWRTSRITNSMYYYNSALGAMSLENSLSLLWTMLESLIPYRNTESDLEAVQNYVVQMISIGGLARDVGALAGRLILQSYVNDHCYSSISVESKRKIRDTNTLKWWYQWVISSNQTENKFKILTKTNNLLALTYAQLGRMLQEGKVSALLSRFKKSGSSVSYQLERAYFHRNRIVHSGDLVNEYNNLWTHIEWYCGKILAYFMYQVEFKRNFPSTEQAFKALEADYRYLITYLERNGEMKINSVPERIESILLSPYFQAILPED